MILKNFFRRLIMLLLFLAAFYITVTSISNLTFADIHEAMEQSKRDELQVSVPSEEVEEPTTLEEAINVEQYPTVTVVATGYTAGVESTGKTPDHPGYGITYSGVYVKRDLYSTIAADPSVFPIGTVLYIPNYGYGVVADTGSAIKGNKIDLYYDTVEEVYNEWGKKEVDVYVVDKGNGHLTEEVLRTLNETEALQVFRQQINEK